MLTIPIGKLTQATVDVSVLMSSLLIAALLRYDGNPTWLQMKPILLCGPYIIILQYLVLTVFGVHRFAWRYISLQETVLIFFSLFLSAIVLVYIRLITPHLAQVYPVFRNAIIPLGVIVIDFALAFCCIVGVRGLRRLQIEKFERFTHRRISKTPATRIVMVGAGNEGHAVVRELVARPDIGLLPVGFIDDDMSRKGTWIHGVPVLGTIQDLETICRKCHAKQVLIALAEPDGDLIRSIFTQCEHAGISAKIIPGLHELVAGQVSGLGSIRDVAIEDLLRRDPVRLDTEVVADFLKDRVVMVTGAGGSIGSEICRQIVQFKPQKLVLIERSELALFEIHRELIAQHPDIFIPCMADICDQERMTTLLEQYQPSVLFHAAAHKHVPLMEQNVSEAIKNNLGGTKIVADLALNFEVESFVMISTDKAVNPTSVMGATKRASELYLQALSERGKTRFTAVRFGNVLGSSGSVLHLFREQIKQGGPVRVTHPDMRRYFMTIPEACQLVMQAGAMGKGGEIFILDMGKLIKIIDLAHDLIRLSGLVPGQDIHLDFVGLRPGEKLYEELAFDDEHAERTSHEKIFIGKLLPVDALVVEKEVRTLLARADRVDSNQLRYDLKKLVPEFSGITNDSAEIIRRSSPPSSMITHPIRESVH